MDGWMYLELEFVPRNHANYLATSGLGFRISILIYTLSLVYNNQFIFLYSLFM